MKDKKNRGRPPIAKNKDVTIDKERQNITPMPQGGDNPEFVKQLSDIANPPKENRGGVREGAGRPIGTNDRALALKAMGDKARPEIVGLIRLPFVVWSQLVKIDSIELTEKEAELIGLPASQLIGYYIPDTENPIVIAWAGLVGALSAIMIPRMAAIKRANDQKAGIKAIDGVGSVNGQARVPASDLNQKKEPPKGEKIEIGSNGFPVNELKPQTI